MRKVILGSIMFLICMTSCAQPAHNTIQADIKKELGSNCTEVKIMGSGKSSKEFENGAWINYFRIPINATLNTDKQGVERIMKGAAVYILSGSNYRFVKYNPATAEYRGLAKPNISEIKSFVQALPDLALGGKANIITEVENINIYENQITWHTMLSVSLQCDYTYWYKKSNTQLEQVKEPYELRLYRRDVNAPWHQATLISPNAANDSRKKTVMSTKPNNNESTIIMKAMNKTAIDNFNALPDVVIPAYTNPEDMATWMNELFIEKDAAKAEKMLLTLIHPSQKNAAGILNPFAADLMNKMMTGVQNNFSSYVDQYCRNLSVKNTSSNSIEWWNKDRSKFCRMTISYEGKKWYLTDLSINIWQAFNKTQVEKTQSTICN